MQWHRFYRPFCQPFIAGVAVGLTLAVIFMAPLADYTSNITFFLAAEKPKTHENSYPEIDVGTHKDTDFFHRMTNSSLANYLHGNVRILCWIMTGPKNHKSKAKHVKATWGKRCNYLLFMSTEEDKNLPSIALPVVEDRANLWGKTKETMKYVYKHYYNKADWFFKADDDTYAVMENMRYMLYKQNTSEPIYFGCRFKLLVKQGYMSGGAGYVLSKEALKRFVEDALPDEEKCKHNNTGDEDVEIGKCLEAVGVKPGDSRDTEGRSRFVPIFILDLVIPDFLRNDSWYWQYIYYPHKKGMECCSDNLITTHYVSSNNMYLLEYLIYHVKAFGISYNPTMEFLEQEERYPSTSHNTSKSNSIDNNTIQDDIS